MSAIGRAPDGECVMALDGNSSPSGRRSFMKRMATLAAAMLTDRAAAAQTSAVIGNSGGPHHDQRHDLRRCGQAP